MKIFFFLNEHSVNHHPLVFTVNMHDLVDTFNDHTQLDFEPDQVRLYLNVYSFEFSQLFETTVT